MTTDPFAPAALCAALVGTLTLVAALGTASAVAAVRSPGARAPVAWTADQQAALDAGHPENLWAP